MTLRNIAASTQDWLNGNHEVKVSAYLSEASSPHWLSPVQIPFKTLDDLGQQERGFTREDFLNALARASDPWERQMVMDVENGAVDRLLSEIDAGEDGTLEEL